MKRGVPGEDGVALLSALIVLALFGLVAIYLSLSATTEVRISDNYEALIQARYAAMSGVAHARVLLRGLDFDELLNGPDGVHSTAPDYMASARAFEFRNPFEWSLARFVDCVSPGADITGRPDDGLINTGVCAGTAGMALIPPAGVPFNDGGARSAVLARYFVKVTDNNGEAEERAGDAAGDPFHDGDGVILIRSMGIATTLREKIGLAVKRNAVAVFESRYLRRSTFDCSAPLVILGDAVVPSAGAVFEGSGFQIRGSPAGPGIAVIDPDPAGGTPPALQLAGVLPPDRAGSITGEGSPPSIRDISAAVAADRDKSLLLNAAYLRDFVDRVAPQFADNIYRESRSWAGIGEPDLGAYDPSRPHNAPGQRPLATLVQGDVDIAGTVSGGGLLVVTGRLSVAGTFSFSGLVLVIGAGDLDLRAADLSLSGAIFLAAVPAGTGQPWGIPKVTVGGNTRLETNPEAVRAALRLIPPTQMGFREVLSGLDPKP